MFVKTQSVMKSGFKCKKQNKNIFVLVRKQQFTFEYEMKCGCKFKVKKMSLWTIWLFSKTDKLLMNGEAFYSHKLNIIIASNWLYIYIYILFKSWTVHILEPQKWWNAVSYSIITNATSSEAMRFIFNL